MESMDDGGVQVMDVSRYDVHDGYNFPNYDISVLVMETKFQASNFTRPICLENSTQVDTKDALIVLGWGMDSKGESGMKLNLAKLQIQDTDYCNAAMETDTGFGDDLFCAEDQALEGSGSCYGDSGGPAFAFNSVLWRYELRGLVSGGAAPQQCGEFGVPRIFTSTSFDGIYSWISEKTEGKNWRALFCKTFKCKPEK